MSKFLTKFDAIQQSRYEWILNHAVIFVDDVLGTLQAPAGFRTDVSSIHALRYMAPLLYAMLVGYGNAACALHDYLYYEARLSRRKCDDVLYRALRAEGVARWRAAIFWAGVRCFGSKYYIT